MNIGYQNLQSKMMSFVAIVLLMSSCQEKEATENDWAQFKKDNFRSANSPVQLDLTTLGEEWVYKAPQLPVPAWYGPANEDTYANSGPLPSMRDYDLAYYPIVIGDKLFYGSTADKAIHCLDTNTGNELWSYTTGGAIHVAPTYQSGKLYFGSDDGFAYCIKASSGKLVWKYSPTEQKSKKVLHNNSLISFWPIRTGVLIEDGLAYFGASLLPWKESYFCALNIKTGKPDVSGSYIKKYDNLTLEGAMASTGTKIIQPQGRISPIFFDKSNGNQKGQLAGTGGCFVLVTPEKNIVHPNNTRAKGIAETIDEQNKPYLEEENKKKADFMSFKDGKEMVVKDSVSFILTDNSISAYNRNSKKVMWANRNYQAHRIIVAGDVLFVGTTDKVYAVSIKNGYPLWEAPVKGAVYALIVANDALYAATGEGYIYAFRSGKGENQLYAQNKDKPEIIEGKIKREKKVVKSNFELSAGPFVNILGANSIEIHFVTEKPEKCTVNFENDFGKETIDEETAKTEHRIVVNNVRKDFTYQYQISAGSQKTKLFEFDNFFNYKEAFPKSNESSKLSGIVSEIKNLNNNTKGIGVVFSAENKEVALQIAEETPLKIIVFENSESKVNALRKEWQKTGFYGGKIAVHFVKDYNEIPLTSDVANFVLVSNYELSSANEVIRLIKPKGHAVLEGKKNKYQKWFSTSKNAWQVTQFKSNNIDLIRKNPIDDVGEWSHQYGLANNSSFGGESLWGSSATEDFDIQWMGRPGPRFQTDRSGRKPSPLAINGKMFVQGRERIIAVDAYNGNVHWSKEIPDLSRMNIPRDCSNWIADEDYLYIAHKNNLLKIDNKDGEIKTIVPVIKNKNNVVNDWGYIALVNDKIIGSSVEKGSNYTDYYGGEGWYDAPSGTQTYQVVSNSIFSMDKNGQEVLWMYSKPLTHIINSTITITNNQICFVESRNSKLKLIGGRANPEVFKKLYMVSLDSETGVVNWEHPINTIPGVTAYSMAGAKDRLVIVSSNGGKYHIYNYNGTTGNLVWQKEQSWFSDNHGGHMSRPAIVDNRLIVKPAMYDLNSGELLKQEVPKAGHGCATYALSEQSIFYRGGSVTQFNFDTDKFSKWERLRPDCWLSTIPAQGMVLSPEAGGGCSCGNWLETSMVFAPISRAPISFLYKDEKFIDSMSITIKARDIKNKKIYYTVDGSNPTDKSNVYIKPILIAKSTKLKAVIYVEKSGEFVPFIRTKEFIRLRPEPTVVELPELINSNWQFTIDKNGTTGEVYYTIDGSLPSLNSPKFIKPVVISENTLVKAKTFWKEENKTFESNEISFEVVIPELIDDVTEEVKQGVLMSYYKGNGKESKLPNLNLMKPVKVNNVPFINAEKFEKNKSYALKFEGFLDIPVDGIYTLSNSTSESYCIVHFQKNKQLENKGTEEKQLVLPLKKGLHPITVEYFVGKPTPGFNLEIEGPGLKKQEVQPDMLYSKK